MKLVCRNYNNNNNKDICLSYKKHNRKYTIVEIVKFYVVDEFSARSWYPTYALVITRKMILWKSLSSTNVNTTQCNHTVIGPVEENDPRVKYFYVLFYSQTANYYYTQLRDPITCVNSQFYTAH